MAEDQEEKKRALSFLPALFFSLLQRLEIVSIGEGSFLRSLTTTTRRRLRVLLYSEHRTVKLYTCRRGVSDAETHLGAGASGRRVRNFDNPARHTLLRTSPVIPPDGLRAVLRSLTSRDSTEREHRAGIDRTPPHRSGNSSVPILSTTSWFVPLTIVASMLSDLVYRPLSSYSAFALFILARRAGLYRGRYCLYFTRTSASRVLERIGGTRFPRSHFHVNGRTPSCGARSRSFYYLCTRI